ncbi:hypothetical protein T484DRAFT_1879010, partial [Baffinella frigidus]
MVLNRDRPLTLETFEPAARTQLPARTEGSPRDAHHNLTKAVGVALHERRRNSVDSPQVSPQRSPHRSRHNSPTCASPRMSPSCGEWNSTVDKNRRASLFTSRDLAVIYDSGGEPCSEFARRTSSFTRDVHRLESDSNHSECRWPYLPDFPHMDPVAFEKGKALLGGMELDPACFSSDDLCHLALEIFQAAGLPEELAADVGRVQRFISLCARKHVRQRLPQLLPRVRRDAELLPRVRRHADAVSHGEAHRHARPPQRLGAVCTARCSLVPWRKGPRPLL